MAGSPPVNEVAFAVQFPPIAGLTAVDVGSMYEVFANEFPLVQSAPKLPSFVLTPRPPFQPIFEMDSGLMPRTWMISADSHRLVQIQDDKFSFNWRRSEEEVPYPGFEQLNIEFASAFSRAQDWHEKRFNGQKLAPLVCQLFYQNVLALQDDRGAVPLYRLFKFQREIGRKIANFETRWIEFSPTGGPGHIEMRAGTGLRGGTEAVALLQITAHDAVDLERPAVTWFEGVHRWALELYQAVVVSSEDRT